jgi:hypothetical protein
MHLGAMKALLFSPLFLLFLLSLSRELFPGTELAAMAVTSCRC